MIPLFHHSIIPVWNMQNGCLGIPYYQQFVEFPIHRIIGDFKGCRGINVVSVPARLKFLSLMAKMRIADQKQ
jgi:hypothetical protein